MLLTLGSIGAQAKDVVVDGKGDIPYVIDGRNVVARSGADLCWRTGYWSPGAAASAMAGQFPAGCECDPDVVPKDKCTPPAPVAAVTPTPAAPAPATKSIILSAKALFDFDKAVLKPEGKAAIDTEVLAKLPEFGPLSMVTVSGHTDRLGSAQYNQALSEKRAEAVKNYLVAKGVRADIIETYGFGKTQPVPGVSCSDSLGRAKLIACLEPHRRVVIEVKGSK
jgi:OOP family OmpA-OmpF porin